VFAGDLVSALENLTEAASPLLLGYRPDLLRAEPGVHCFAHELRYRLAPTLRHPSEGFQLLLGEVDARPLHRSYIMILPSFEPGRDGGAGKPAPSTLAAGG